MFSREADVVTRDPRLGVAEARDQTETLLLHLLRVRPEIHVADWLASDGG
jgi:hypothetical protein